MLSNARLRAAIWQDRKLTRREKHAALHLAARRDEASGRCEVELERIPPGTDAVIGLIENDVLIKYENRWIFTADCIILAESKTADPFHKQIAENYLDTF